MNYSSLRSMIEEIDAEKRKDILSNAEVADRLAEELLSLTKAQILALVRPALPAYVAQHRRIPARKAERATAKSHKEIVILPTIGGKKMSAAQRAKAMQSQMRQKWSDLPAGFNLFGRTISWLDATIEDHMNYISILQKKVDGYSRTISLHEQAIMDIKAAGASTLGEAMGNLVAA